MKRVLRFFRREIVFTISLAAALLSFLLAAPGRHTLEGIDTTTLMMLFTLMTVVAGLRLCGVFDLMGRAVARRIRTRRGLAAALAAVCAMGLCGEIAHARLSPGEGNASYRGYIIDAIYNLTPENLERGARYEAEQ